MNPLLQAGITAALLALTTPAQQAHTERQGQHSQQERPRPQQPPLGEQSHERGAQPGTDQTRQRVGQSGDEQGREHSGQPAGEQKPMTQEQREQLIKNFLEQHPEVRQRLREQADANGDGILSEAERAQMRQLIEAKCKEMHQQAEQRRDDRRDDRRDRADTNDDGHVGPQDREHVQNLRDRADRNDDGHVGPLERERAQNIRDRADRNDDGHVGPQERQRAQESQQSGQRERGPREQGRGQQTPPPRGREHH